MSERSPNYTEIAKTYDRRYRENPLAGVGTALSELAREISPRRVLEVGCGTGHWLAHLAPLAPARVGLDLSQAMLLHARGKEPALPLVCGRGDALPFATGSFDLVVCVNAIHHFGRPAGFVQEAYRLLSPKGTVAVVGMDPRVSPQMWYYQYFPETHRADVARFPSWGAVVDWMTAAGFSHLAWRPVERVVDSKLGRAMLANPFLHKHASSQLALLSDEAYQAGLRRIHAAIEEAEARGETVVFEMDLTLAMLTGRRS